MKPDLLDLEVARDSGSFRDPDGFIVRRSGRILRVVLPHAAERWRRLVDSGLAADLQSEGWLVPTHEVTSAPLASEMGLPEGCLILEHQRIPFVSYPYEWTFDMLRDAAVLHLDIIERALSQKWILKDATPYNVQFRGTQPLFVDVLSLEPWRAGDPWPGYNQFCRMFLYPLLLEAYKEIPFQSWLRSELEGLDPVIFSRMFRGLERLRPGVLSHVTLQAYLQKKFAAADYSVRQQIRSAGMDAGIIVRNVSKLKKLLLRLDPPRHSTAWSNYSRVHYAADALAAKEAFLKDCAADRRFNLVWDLGCNDGRFSRIIANASDTVVAMDSDPRIIDRLYRELRSQRPGNILPLLMNVANPSPAQGWASRERASLLERGKPDLTLALALVHHVVLSGNVPLPAFLQWLAQITGELVIEFVSKEDPMVQRLLLNKQDTYSDYHREAFERYLRQGFRALRRTELPGGTRTLYHATAIAES